jgi:ribosomal protein S18 acetylase RimI-like enzyme/predicted O-methyltransferase YrrM
LATGPTISITIVLPSRSAVVLSSSVVGPGPTSLQRATTADEPFLRRMVYEALYVPAGQPPFPEAVLDRPDIRHYYLGFGRRPGDIGRIAETGAGEPVGATWVRQLTSADPGYGYVDDDTPELTIAVTAPYRGAGVGSALLADLLVEVPRCSLSVDVRNPARSLYERFGFEKVGGSGDSLTMLRTAPARRADIAAAIAGPSLGWGPGAMLPAGILAVCDDVIANDRRRVVELGSGLSTVLLARLLTRLRGPHDWRLAAVEHDRAWVRQVTAELDRERIGHHVTIVHAPLAEHALTQDGLQWYDDAAMAAGLDRALGGQRIDLLVVDGPPAFAPGFGLARYPALPALHHRLWPGATVVLDDIDRPGEREVLRRWEVEVGLRFRRLEPARLAVATV